MPYQQPTRSGRHAAHLRLPRAARRPPRPHHRKSPRSYGTCLVRQKLVAEVIEQWALIEVRALAPGGAFEPAAHEFTALDQGHDLGELPVGHLTEPVNR